MTELIDAIKKGAQRLKKYLFLLSLGNINAEFQKASYNGDLEIVKYLVSLGADIRSNNDYTVQWASANDHIQVVKYLCEAGANISKISEKDKKYIAFCQKMEAKKKDRAQKKIYFWWIPICYDVNRECGQRMKQNNLEKAIELGYEFSN